VAIGLPLCQIRIMQVLKEIHVKGGGCIQLCHGDLSMLTAEDDVDLLVLSAFPNSYSPTQRSLVGALSRRGISVERLASDKYADLRETTSCWLSKELDVDECGFRRVLCFEPASAASAADSVGDVFRALVAFVGGQSGASNVAMPLLATGSMRRTVSQMMPAILDSAVHWMETGLPIQRLMIAVEEADDGVAAEEFERWMSRRVLPTPADRLDADRPIDVFVSYAHVDGSGAARIVHDAIMERRPTAKVFLDELSIVPGVSWQQAIYDSLNDCRAIVALLTPGYLKSIPCQEEINIAMIRNRASERPVLYPFYTRTSELPAHLQALQFIDCREVNEAALQSACATVLDS